MNLDALKSYAFEPIEQELTWRDTILYALGLGYGSDPIDRSQLQFVYEEGLKAVPSMACGMGYAGFWMQSAELEIDWLRLLHGEHYYEIHSPLPVEGTLTARYRITGVDDKGEGRGAVVNFEKSLYDESGTLLATIEQSNFLRGDGGCGSLGNPAKPRPRVPERLPDFTSEIQTSRQIALLYRLNGDYNPVHADPDLAKEAGFHEPWMAGMCSMGLAIRAVIGQFCEDDPTRIRSMFVRFRNVCFPGETMRYEFYETRDGVQFRAVSKERKEIILDRGEVRFR